MTILDANSIVVRSRQRSGERLPDDGFIASVAKNLIHPIVVRREDDEIILVAGGMRLKALISAGITSLEENKHFRFMNDLSPLEAQIVELEENVKRLDLPWRDHIRATGQIHELYSSLNKDWSAKKTAEELNISHAHALKLLMVFKNLDTPALKDSTGIDHSYGILQNQAERRAASIINEITQTGKEIFNGRENNGNDSNTVPNTVGSVSDTIGSQSSENQVQSGQDSGVQGNERISRQSTQQIINADFLEWIKTYNGPKFTLIHCDFPYDVDYTKYAHSVTSTDEDYDFKGFSVLLDSMCENIDKIASYSSHLVFWFSMKFYQETKDKLEKAGYYVHTHPLIWLKSDNAGIIPGRDNMFPRRIYETAFLCSKGKRPLNKSLSNAIALPTVTSPHPSHKPEAVLKHFLSMLVDETTDILDPTAGSGSALKVASSLGARSVLGLEIKKEYVEASK